MEVANDWDDYWRRQGSRTSRAGTAISGEKGIADYLVYDLPERVTVAENQTKQVGFLDVAGVKSKKVYEYKAGYFNSQQDPEHCDVILGFMNKERAMPKGVVRVYMRDSQGEAKFLGENSVDHTPAGSEVSIKIGEAFDVTAQGTLVSSEKIRAYRTRYSMSYSFKNAKPTPVTVEFRQSGLWRDGDVEKESLKSRRIDASMIGWSVPVPANGETVLTYTVDSGS
jgi:hypothetical protein